MESLDQNINTIYKQIIDEKSEQIDQAHRLNKELKKYLRSYKPKQQFDASTCLMIKIIFDNPNNCFNEFLEHEKILNLLNKFPEEYFKFFKKEIKNGLTKTENYDYNYNINIFSNYIRYLLDSCHDVENNRIHIKQILDNNFHIKLLDYISQIRNQNIIVDLLNHPVAKELAKLEWKRHRAFYYIQLFLNCSVILLIFGFTVIFKVSCQKNLFSIQTYPESNYSVIVNNGCTPLKSLIVDRNLKLENIVGVIKIVRSNDLMLIFLSVFNICIVFFSLFIAFNDLFMMICLYIPFNTLKNLFAIIFIMLFFINQFAILESWFSWKHSYFNFLIIQHICYIYSMLSVVTILRKMPAIGIYLILSSNKILGISALVTLGRLFNNFINENLKTINQFNPKIKIYSNETPNGNLSYLNDVADSIKNSFSSQLADYKVMLYVIQNNYIIFFFVSFVFFLLFGSLVQKLMASDVDLSKADLEKRLLKLRFIKIMHSPLFKHLCLCTNKLNNEYKIKNKSEDNDNFIYRLLRRIQYRWKSNNYYTEILKKYKFDEKNKESSAKRNQYNDFKHKSEAQAQNQNTRFPFENEKNKTNDGQNLVEEYSEYEVLNQLGRNSVRQSTFKKYESKNKQTNIETVSLYENIKYN